MCAGHLYVRGTNGKAQRFAPLKKDGTPYQAISKKLIEEHKARIGITTQLGNHQDTGYLFNWAGKLAMQAAFDSAFDYVNGVLVRDTFKGWDEPTKQLAKERFNEASTAAANRGTEIHDGIDSFLKGGELSDDPVIATAQRDVWTWLESQGVDMTHIHAEHCVIFEGGISVPTEDGQGIEKVLEIANGATADLITKRLLADWKTIELSGGKYYTGKAAHVGQLAFCRHAASQDGICDPDAKTCNVYIDRTTGKIVEVKTWTEKELELGLIWAAHCYETDRALAALEKEIK
jgi:hypothetical protein